MSLFFAANRWGSGEGVLDYASWARRILHACVHKGEEAGSGFPMWNPENHLIKFVPNCEFTDPSYLLPHFYELFALWSDECDRPFWHAAATASRQYLREACHARTGLSAEYAEYDGRKKQGHGKKFFAVRGGSIRIFAAVSMTGPGKIAGFCPRSTMRVPQPDIIEHFGNADAVPQPPERCLSRKAGIVRCCPKQKIRTLFGKRPDFQQVQRLSWITLPFCNTARMFRSSSARTTLP